MDDLGGDLLARLSLFTIDLTLSKFPLAERQALVVLLGQEVVLVLELERLLLDFLPLEVLLVSERRANEATGMCESCDSLTKEQRRSRSSYRGADGDLLAHAVAADHDLRRLRARRIEHLGLDLRGEMSAQREILYLATGVPSGIHAMSTHGAAPSL